MLTKSEIDKTSLYKMFNDFCLSRMQDESKANQVAKILGEAFASSRHSIITIAKNLDDGIGDYVSQVYFIEKLNTLFATYPNVNLKNISYISDKKQGIAKIIREGKIEENTVFVMGANEKYSSDKTNILGIPNNKDEEALVSQVIGQADFVFNLAIGLVENEKELGIRNTTSSIYDPSRNLKLFPKGNAFIESWTQYSFQSKANSRLNDRFENNYISSVYNGPIFTEHAMGFHENQMGIRFIQSILDKIEKDRSTLLSLLSFSLSNVIPLENTNNEKQSFALGYLQSLHATHGFVLMATQTSPGQGDMNIVVNMDHFKDAETKSFDLISNKLNLFAEKLTKCGITNLEFIENGIVVKTAQLTKEPENQRTLRLIDFKGISNSDKEVLYGLAEMIGCSGDTSISEMMTSGLKKNKTALPFAQRYITSNSSCILSILEEVKAFAKRAGVQHTALCDYLQFLHEKNKLQVDDSYGRASRTMEFDYKLEYGEIIENNREEITNSWHEFCKFNFHHRNEASHFNELLVTYTLHRLLLDNNLEQFKEVSTLLGKSALQHETFLHLAVKSNNLEAVKYIVENNLSDVNKTHPFNNFTPLHLAVHQQNEKIVYFLIEQNINFKALDAQGKSALQIAVEKGNLNLTDILFGRDLTFLEDSQGYFNNLLQIAVKNNHKNLIPLLITKGKVTNPKTVHMALEKKDIDIIKILIDSWKGSTLNQFISPAIAYGNDISIIKMLLGANQNVNLKNMLFSNRDILDQAINQNNPNLEVIKLLLEYGFDVNYRSQYGCNSTPLHLAVQGKKLNVVKLLLASGADINVKDPFNKTPLDLSEDKEISSVLEDARLRLEEVQKSENLNVASNSNENQTGSFTYENPNSTTFFSQQKTESEQQDNDALSSPSSSPRRKKAKTRH